jgi:hypothetical protein
MKVEVLYFNGCPMYEAATKTLRAVLSEEGWRPRSSLSLSIAMRRSGGFAFPIVPPYRSMDATCSPHRSVKTDRWVPCLHDAGAAEELPDGRCAPGGVGLALA